MPTTVVTGSASGIGAAVCRHLQAAGHRVVGIDRAQADIVADLSSASGRQAAVAAAIDACGGVLDGLVCCAGVGVTAPSCGLIVSMNYFGMSTLVDGLAECRQQGHRPAVLLVGSVAAVQPGVEQIPLVETLLTGDEARAVADADAMAQPAAAYAASKFAITAYARSKAVEWGPRGIRFNVGAPGAVETPLHKASLDDPRFGQAVHESATNDHRTTVDECAQSVLDARQSHLNNGATLADLYDPLYMPASLLKAHQNLDRAVDRCYRRENFETEREPVEFLFGLYEELTSSKK